MGASRTGSFAHRCHRLAYQETGTGDRPIVLLPGLLLPRRMHDPVARRLAERGNRVLTLDLLSHGESDRARGVGRYSMATFAEQTVALLDHLEIDEAVVGGTSLGANVALEAAVLAPERLRGLVLEMPVLEGGYVAAMFVLPPVLLAIRGGARVLRPLGALARRVPGGATGARRLAPLPGRARTRTPPPTCSTACSTGAPRRRAGSASGSPPRRS